MVSRLAPDLAPSVRDRILREAAGNPLALAELSATIRDDAASGEGLRDLLPLSARLEREFAARADDLPHDTQWLLLIAALDDRDGVSEILAAAGVPAVGDHAGGRRATHRGRRPLAPIPSSADPFGGPAAGDRRGTARGTPRAGGSRRRLRSGGMASRGGDRRARRVGRRAPRRRRRTGDPARRAHRRGCGAPAGGNAECGWPRAGHAAPARRGRRERDRSHGRDRPDARRRGADRRPGPRGSPPGLDHGSVTDRAAVTPREGETPVRHRRRRSGQERRARRIWALPCSNSPPPAVGGWTRARRSARRSPSTARELADRDRLPRRVPELDRAGGPRRRAAGLPDRACAVGEARQWGRRAAIRAPQPSGWARWIWPSTSSAPRSPGSARRADSACSPAR